MNILLCSQIERLNIVKMSVLPKMIYCIDLTHYLLNLSDDFLCFPVTTRKNFRPKYSDLVKLLKEEHKEMQIQEEEIKLLTKSSKVQKYFLREQENGEKKTVFE